MITVKKAEELVLRRAKSFGVEKVKLLESFNRVLLDDVLADRDYPPFDRSTMDGIAINFNAYKKGVREFKIISTISAGQKPIEIKNTNECVKIMTGAPVPSTCDTIIPVEDLKIGNLNAIVTVNNIKSGLFIHKKGSDKKRKEVVLKKGTVITPEVVPVLASVGRGFVAVSKLPKVAVISTGDELVEVHKRPNNFQIRRSNDYAISASLSVYGIKADLLHIKDERELIEKVVQKSLHKYDVVIITGGVSKGEFDYVYQVLEKLKVERIFHGIAQKPGKPMWFGKNKKGRIVFALPGNPVSSFLCVNRYVVPYLRKSLGILKNNNIDRVSLSSDTLSNPELTLFTQASLKTDKNGKLLATPLTHHGSGDFIGIIGADVFLELPPQKTPYKKGTVCKVWPFKSL